MKGRLSGALKMPEDIVVLDGITRSGKFWFADLIAYFETMEPVIHEPALDLIAIMAKHGELDQPAGVVLFQSILSHRCFDLSIGRNMNSRLADSSSVYNHPRRADLLSRIHTVKDRAYEDNKPLEFRGAYPVLAHDWLSAWSVQPQALPAAKMIRIERHPVDLVYAWFDTGIGLGNMSFSYRFESESISVPWFARSFAESFASMREMDRIIASVEFLFESSRNNIREMQKHPETFLLTSYEELGSNSARTVERLSAFLGKKPLPQMAGFLESQKSKMRSAQHLEERRKEKREIIVRNASEEYVRRLDLIASGYGKI